MRIVHYILSSYEDGDWSGVPRFDYELKKAIPNLITITKRKIFPNNINQYLKFGDIIITDNGLCNDVDEKYKCIVVQHGLARTHLEREPSWMGTHYVEQQDKMALRKNNFYVSTSTFMQEELYKKYNLKSKTILNSTNLQELKKDSQNNKPIIIGDWRDNNKGLLIIDKLRNSLTQYEFKQIKCSFFDKEKEYRNADAYLCLSLSEGNSYSMLDALHYNIPVISTNVGLFANDYQQNYGIKINYLERENIEIIKFSIESIILNKKLFSPRNKIIEIMSFDNWAIEWNNIIKEVYYG